MVRVLKVGGAQHVEHVVDDGGAGVIGDRTGVWWWRGATVALPLREGADADPGREANRGVAECVLL